MGCRDHGTPAPASSSRQRKVGAQALRSARHSHRYSRPGQAPLLRPGAPWESLKRSFELCRDAGAHILSIESIGGKEVHDQALMYGDIRPLSLPWGYWLRATRRGCGTRSRLCARASNGRSRRRQRLRFRQHGDATRAPAHAAGGAGGGRAGDERGAQPGRVRTRRGGPVEGLRLRRAHHQGHHRLPDFDGRQVGLLRAFQSCRQYRVRHVRSLEQRVGTERASAVGQRAGGLYRNSRLRLPSHECRDPKKARPSGCATG